MEQVPHGAQNLLEWLVEALRFPRRHWPASDGAHVLQARGCVPLHPVGDWFRADLAWVLLAGAITPRAISSSTTILRGANADVNLTLAMALTFVCWIVWAVQEDGVRCVRRTVRSEATTERAEVSSAAVFSPRAVSRSFDSLPSRSRLPALREHLRGARRCSDDGAHAAHRLVGADPLLLPELLVIRAGARLHAPHRRVHVSDLSTTRKGQLT